MATTLSTYNFYDWIASLIRRRGRRIITDKNEDIKCLPEDSSNVLSANDDHVFVTENNEKNSYHTESDTENKKINRLIINIDDTTEIHQRMDEKTTKSNETSIEEDIPEEIITPETSEESSNKKFNENELKNKKRKLFGIDAKANDDDENEESNIGNKFKILDEQLSGSQIAQHFQSKSNQNQLLKNENISKSKNENDDKKSKTITLHHATEKHSENDKEEEEDQNSTTNQNTTNDISEILEEETVTDDDGGGGSGGQLKTRSFELKLDKSFNLEKRDCKSLDTVVKLGNITIDKDFTKVKLNKVNKMKSDEEKETEKTEYDSNNERDQLVEEIIESNHSIEISLDDYKDLSSLDPNIDINNENQINQILGETQVDGLENQENENSKNSSIEEKEINNFKEKILSVVNKSPKSIDDNDLHNFEKNNEDQKIATIKQMEKIQTDFEKEILEDITEESEKASKTLTDSKHQQQRQEQQQQCDDTSNDFDSIVSLNMIQMLENKVKELEDIVNVKDVCLASLNIQLDAAQRRELFANKGENDSLKDIPPSGRESTSLATTTSTEYRTIQEDVGNRLIDYHLEIAQKNCVIEKLTDSLQQSMKIREQLQHQSDQLSQEVQNLRKQLMETIDTVRKPYSWPRDQESSGQRLSEISIDLVSESDDDIDRQILTDEERVSTSTRNSKERQLVEGGTEIYDPEIQPITKQIEQFQKYLNPDELRIFFMVQKKFDDLLSQEIEKTRMKFDNEIKTFNEQYEIEKHEKDIEINRLRQLLANIKGGSTELIELRQELETIHSREMEKLRLYFEKKCADLEKQYSEEVFSQKSARDDSNNSSSDLSEQENLPEETQIQIKENSPRKRTRKELYASPSHRQITPGSDVDSVHDKYPAITIDDLKRFYQEKIHDIKKNYEEIIRRQNEKIKQFETRYADDDFMRKSYHHHYHNHPTIITTTTATTTAMNSTINAVNNDDNELLQGQGTTTSSYIIIDEDEAINESQEIRTIAAEYERRLQEQITLAKEDIIRELENQIQALLSETTTDDHHWPPELILLREKFTAKSQLEIAQLQIKHEEEMARLKADYEKQLNRKLKRNSTFDLSRDIDQIVNEKENLRELSSTFRWLLCELAKCVTICEDDFNSTFMEEFNNLASVVSVQKQNNDENVADKNDTTILNVSTQSNQNSQLNTSSKRIKCVPNVSGLLSVIDDPELIEFINTDKCEMPSFKLKDCLEKLKSEANYLLALSEDLNKKHKHNEEGSEKNDSCEEEDGLKSGINRTPKKVARANSLNENILRNYPNQEQHNVHIRQKIVFSLPTDLQNFQVPNQFSTNEDDIIPLLSADDVTNELNLQVHELKNRLVKSENERQKLQNELETTISRNTELGQELIALREQLEQLDSQKEEYSEGYTIGQIKSPQRIRIEKPTNSFSQLQEKARNLLSTPTKVISDNSQILLQMIEEFCREGDKVVDDGKKEKEDLQSQIDAADKQLRSIRQFLDDQAAERELERDEFLKEIEKLKNQIKDKDKEKSSYEVASREMEQMDQQIKDLTQKMSELENKKDKLEIELKASIDKIFVLREIISELETQIETKSLNEHVLNEKIKELELFIASQTRLNEDLQNQVDHFKTEIGQDYQDKISHLEDQLRNARTSAEQSVIWNQITEQLRDIEATLEQKIKTLESLHHSVCSISCSTSPIEDVSVQGQMKVLTTTATTTALTSAIPINNPLLAAIVTPQGSPINMSPRSSSSSSLQQSLPIDEVQRVYEKLSKHTRVEEAAIKRIQDLEMQVVNIRTNFAELQHERDVLQEKMSEQLQRISVLQTKLDEQRHRAEELQRQGTSDLTIRIHDLQNELQTLKETLSVRDKQIANLKNQLEQSKLIIERQEAEFTVGVQTDQSVFEKLENELKLKTEENRKLKDKMKTEMINRLALPDLMETMLADKNEEIDHLKEQLESKEKELQGILELNLNQENSGSNDKEKKKVSAEEDVEAKLSARTLSDIHSISEYDEPEAIRRAPLEEISPFMLPDVPQVPEQTMESRKQTTVESNKVRFIAPQSTGPTATTIPSYDAPDYFYQSSVVKNGINSATPIPRRINFSDLTDDSKIKDATPKIQEIAECDEIRILNDKLKTAEEEIENLKILKENIESEKNNEIESLKSNLIEKTKQLESLSTERNQLNEKIQELSKKLEMYLKLESSLKEKEANLSELQKEITVTREEFSKIENELRNKTEELINLKENNDKLTLENQMLKETNDSEQKVKSLEQRIEILTNTIKEKDDLLSKHEKNMANLQQTEKDLLEKVSKLELEIKTIKALSNADVFKDELNLTKVELSQKMLLYEKCLLDIETYQKEIERLNSKIRDKDMIIASLSNDSNSLKDMIATIQQKLENNENLNEVKRKLNEAKQRNSELEQRNSVLEVELDKLRSNSSDNSKPYSVDEIAEQVERELNYSAQLDSKILKVIKSDEENGGLSTRLKTDQEKLIERDLLNQIQSLRSDLEDEKKQKMKVQEDLNEEKRYSQEIQQQDAEIIQALRIRLEEALQKEEEFHKVLDEERAKCDRLSTQITVLQRSEARKASMQLKSPPDSPRKVAKDFELDAMERLKTEIKLLTAQNERERERVTDLQRVLEREKIRFETELSDRINYAEKLKKEMEKIAHEKDLAENQAEHLEERLSLASKEIESLEARITALQEAETRRAHRRGKERVENTQNAVELQELKSKVTALETERDHLNHIIAMLRSDIDRGAQRETKLAEALANNGSDAIVPEQFMQKLKEMNYLLAENKKENRQMADTLQYLTEERKSLQRKVEELEITNQNGTAMATNLMEMEERANHLFGRYLRVESHRKALVHQKRYLLIVLQTYQENELKTLALLNMNVPKKSKRKLFKSVALAVIAIQRMKFIVRRWQTGKRIVTKSVFHIQAQKRSTLPIMNNGPPASTSTSPPYHDKSATLSGRINYVDNPLKPLHAPGLISDFSEQKTNWIQWKK